MDKNIFSDIPSGIYLSYDSNIGGLANHKLAFAGIQD